VTRPNPNMHSESHTLGVSFLRMTFDGISNRMYGTKKMTRATLYLLPSSLSSFERPKTSALAMLTLLSLAWSYQITF